VFERATDHEDID